MGTNFPYTSVDYYSENFSATDLQITYEEIEKTEKNHFRDEIEFIFVRSGSATLEINNSCLSVSEGFLIQLMPYHIHRFIFKPNEKIKFYRIRASLGLLIMTSTDKKIYQEALISLDKTWPLILLNKMDNNNLLHFCQLVLSEKKTGSKNQQTLNISLISYISYFFQKGLERKQYLIANKSNTVSWLCLQYLHFHHQEVITPEKVATNLGLTEKEVKQSIQQLTGKSFNKTLNQVRIRNAAALLQFDGLSINQIGKICGYQTDANFYKQFKLIHGKTPSEYQRNSQIGMSLHSADAWDIAIFMLKNCRSPLLLSLLSRHINLSEKKINTLLEETFGLNFKTLLTSFRIKIAKILFDTTTLSAKEVADLVGFSNEKTLLRHYRKDLDESLRRKQI